ncbi:MAG: hypothetical protein ACRD3M_02540 [Thermoanaerobaculia bacterium]
MNTSENEVERLLGRGPSDDPVRRNLAAARFYQAYRELDFAPPDPELDGGFAGLPLPRGRGRPPGP